MCVSAQRCLGRRLESVMVKDPGSNPSLFAHLHIYLFNKHFHCVDSGPGPDRSFSCNKLLFSVAVSSIFSLLERFRKSQGGQPLNSLVGTPPVAGEYDSGEVRSRGRRNGAAPGSCSAPGGHSGSLEHLPVSTRTRGLGGCRQLPAGVQGPGGDLSSCGR